MWSEVVLPELLVLVSAWLSSDLKHNLFVSLSGWRITGGNMRSSHCSLCWRYFDHFTSLICFPCNNFSHNSLTQIQIRKLTPHVLITLGGRERRHFTFTCNNYWKRITLILIRTPWQESLRYLYISDCSHAFLGEILIVYLIREF